MSSRDRSLIAVVVLVLVAIAGYFLVVAPEHHKANQIQSQITSEQTDLSQAVAQVQAGQAAEAQYKLYAEQLKSIKAAVPSDEQVPQLINELQAASTKNQVGFESVSTSSSSSASTTAAAPSAATAASTTSSTTVAAFPSQNFSLSFTGSYFAVADLLGTLANFVHADDKHFKASGRLISISSVSLAPGDSAGTTNSSAAPGDVTANVTALDYDIPTASLASAPTPTAGG